MTLFGEDQTLQHQLLLPKKNRSPFFVLNLPDGGKQTAEKIVGPERTEKSFRLCSSLQKQDISFDISFGYSCHSLSTPALFNTIHSKPFYKR